MLELGAQVAYDYTLWAWNNVPGRSLYAMSAPWVLAHSLATSTPCVHILPIGSSKKKTDKKTGPGTATYTPYPTTMSDHEGRSELPHVSEVILDGFSAHDFTPEALSVPSELYSVLYLGHIL